MMYVAPFYVLFFFKQKTAYEMRISDGVQTCALPISYLQLRGTQAQLDITRQNLEVADRTLRLAESRERNGVATRFETSSARAQLATVEALVPELVQRRNTLMNALALLLGRSEEHTSELQSLMRISYAVFCLKTKNKTKQRA